LQQFANGAVGLDGMSEWNSEIDRVAILSPDSGSLQDGCCFQLGDDVLHSSFGDSDLSGNFAQRDGGVLEEQYEDVSVVGEECPAGIFWCCGCCGCNGGRGADCAGYRGCG
jgi:hypothetical protein